MPLLFLQIIRHQSLISFQNDYRVVAKHKTINTKAILYYNMNPNKNISKKGIA